MDILEAVSFELGSTKAYRNMGYQISTSSSITSAFSNKIHGNTVGGNFSLWVDGNGQECYSPVNTNFPANARFWHAIIKERVANVRAQHILFLRQGTVQASVRIRADGLVDLYRGSSVSGGSLLNTSVSTVTKTGKFWIAIETLFQDAGGIFTVWINGVQYVTFSGDTKAHASLTGYDQYGFSGSATNTFDGYVDDIIITNNTAGRLAEVVCLPSTVNSVNSGSFTGLVPNTGAARYLNVATPLNEATYNSIGSTGEDLYGHTPMVGIPTTIHTVSVAVSGNRQGSLTTFTPRLKSGAAPTVSGAAQIMPATTSEQATNSLWETDPDGGGSWSISKVNGSLIGLEVG